LKSFTDSIRHERSVTVGSVRLPLCDVPVISQTVFAPVA